MVTQTHVNIIIRTLSVLLNALFIQYWLTHPVSDISMFSILRISYWCLILTLAGSNLWHQYCCYSYFSNYIQQWLTHTVHCSPCCGDVVVTILQSLDNLTDNFPSAKHSKFCVNFPADVSPCICTCTMIVSFNCFIVPNRSNDKRFRRWWVKNRRCTNFRALAGNTWTTKQRRELFLQTHNMISFEWLMSSNVYPLAVTWENIQTCVIVVQQKSNPKFVSITLQYI